MPLNCWKPVFGRRSSITRFDGTPRNRVAAACESMPPPGRSSPALRPPPPANRPNLVVPHDGAAERIAAVLGAVRPVHHLNAFDRRLIDQVQERVDTAALRAVRVAHAVD